MGAPRRGAQPANRGGRTRKLDAATLAELETAIRRKRVAQENVLLGQKLDVDERLERGTAYLEAAAELAKLEQEIRPRSS